jgi:hypothetical protein
VVEAVDDIYRRLSVRSCFCSRDGFLPPQAQAHWLKAWEEAPMTLFVYKTSYLQQHPFNRFPKDGFSTQ